MSHRPHRRQRYEDLRDLFHRLVVNSSRVPAPPAAPPPRGTIVIEHAADCAFEVGRCSCEPEARVQPAGTANPELEADT